MSERKSIPSPYAAVFAVACHLYNDSLLQVIADLFPDEEIHPNYRDEWIARFDRGFGFAVGKMDDDTFRRFVDGSLAAHGDFAASRFPAEDTPEAVNYAQSEVDHYKRQAAALADALAALLDLISELGVVATPDGRIERARAALQAAGR